jgi:hypothetical protein
MESVKLGNEPAIGHTKSASKNNTRIVAVSPARPPSLADNQRNAGYADIAMMTAQSKTLTNGAMIAIEQTTISAMSPKRMMLSAVNFSVVIDVAGSLFPAIGIDL